MYATLACLRRCYPQWDIQLEFPVWTATRRPSPTVVHFVYGRTTDELENKIRNAEAEYAAEAAPRLPALPRQRDRESGHHDGAAGP